ncbi:MAG: GNAT family N-acetyltransferase [Candidatus Thiodiazotropha sp.]
MTLIIEAISRLHDRNAFDCSVVGLNHFFKHQARQKPVKHTSKTYVACQDSRPTSVVGYYTLTGYSVLTPPEHRVYKKYPHPLSAIKLARLAVDRSHQRKRVGEILLIDAINRTARAAEQISAIGLFVDPMTPEVVPFYSQYGFLPADPADSSRIELWLPIDSCIDLSNSLS